MTEQVLHQVEINYIDSLLHDDSQQRSAASGVATAAGVNLISNSASQQTLDAKLTVNPEPAADSLYQLVLVDGLKLAIALSEITQAVDQSNAIIKNHLFFHDGEQLTIVNLAALLRPEQKVLETGTDSKQYLLIQHRQLAIECQQILEMETIEKNLVCWRNENSQRKWLAGTVKQQGIAILDLAMLQQMHNSE